MGSLHLSQFKKQASFFLKEKLKKARLALTDVTEAELMTEDATNEDPWGPETRKMAKISQAAFDVDDYWRVVEVLRKRLTVVDAKHSRSTVKTLVLLEYLLTHGPESVAAEFRSDEDALRQLTQFQYVDALGYDWGQSIQRKAERILELLNQEKLLKLERNRARRVSRGIHGSGSFSSRASSLPAFTSLNSRCSNAGEKIGISNELEINQSTENANKKNEGDFKIYSKSISSLGISTNLQNEEVSNAQVHRDDPTTTRSDKAKNPESGNNGNEYPSNNYWQPFEAGSMSTDKPPSNCSSLDNDIQNLIRNDQQKGQAVDEIHSNSSKNNDSDGLHEYNSRLDTENEPLLKSSTDEQNTNLAAFACNEIHPFRDTEDEQNNSLAAFACNEIHPFGDTEDDTTAGLLSQRNKKSPVSVLDFPISARRAINI